MAKEHDMRLERNGNRPAFLKDPELKARYDLMLENICKLHGPSKGDLELLCDDTMKSIVTHLQLSLEPDPADLESQYQQGVVDYMKLSALVTEHNLQRVMKVLQ